MLDLSVIIVSWNVRDLLDKCLDSLRQSRRPLRASERTRFSTWRSSSWIPPASDGSAEMIRERYPEVALLVQQVENIGFTRGNNIGLEQARGAYLLLLNPDTEVSPGALAASDRVSCPSIREPASSDRARSTATAAINPRAAASLHSDDRRLRKHLALRLGAPQVCRAQLPDARYAKTKTSWRRTGYRGQLSCFGERS